MPEYVSNDWKGAERPFSFFPMIGKTREKVSNDWKNTRKSFQRLEKVRKKFPIIGKKD